MTTKNETESIYEILNVTPPASGETIDKLVDIVSIEHARDVLGRGLSKSQRKKNSEFYFGTGYDDNFYNRVLNFVYGNSGELSADDKEQLAQYLPLKLRLIASADPISITKNMVFPQDHAPVLLDAPKIVFSEKGAITMNATELTILTKEVEVNSEAPEGLNYHIGFFAAQGKPGADGSQAPSGQTGAQGKGGTGYADQGGNGTDGLDGVKGGDGGTGEPSKHGNLQLGSVKKKEGLTSPLTIYAAQSPGGAGGNGGDGGCGGNGGTGGNAHSSGCDKLSPGGTGGTGGNGGTGGAGGNGGAGTHGLPINYTYSKGSEIYIGTSSQNSSQAPGGKGGNGGAGGAGGAGGMGTKHRGHGAVGVQGKTGASGVSGQLGNIGIKAQIRGTPDNE
jgi:hypothetical protein